MHQHAEYGVAALHGRSVRERAQALLDIAHPAFRDVTARLWERGVIPDFRAPDGIRIGLSPLSTTFAEVLVGVEAIGEELRRAGLALADANARNTRLLEASAELVERWTQYLKHVISRSLTYQQDGSAQGPQGRRVLDRTA